MTSTSPQADHRAAFPTRTIRATGDTPEDVAAQLDALEGQVVNGFLVTHVATRAHRPFLYEGRWTAFVYCEGVEDVPWM